MGISWSMDPQGFQQAKEAAKEALAKFPETESETKEA
jgi:hypothetical protein